MSRWLRRGAVIAVLVAVAVILGVRFGGHEPAIGPSDGSGFFALAPPAFAQTASADEFPHSEVGICAYVNMGDPIDLSRSESAFTGIEASEETYIIGTVALPSLAEDMWPHLYIGSDGWMMAYYPKTEPTSRIVQWNGYQQGEVTTTTLLDALTQAAQDIGLNTSTILSSMGFHHFQYPSATKLLIAIDTTAGTDTFTYTIPSSLNLYEASWSHHAEDASSSYGTYTEVDSVRIYSGGGGFYVACGNLDTRFRTPESAHTVELYCTRSWAGAAIVFLHN